jgi:hypothetical protein
MSAGDWFLSAFLSLFHIAVILFRRQICARIDQHGLRAESALLHPKKRAKILPI